MSNNYFWLFFLGDVVETQTILILSNCVRKRVCLLIMDSMMNSKPIPMVSSNRRIQDLLDFFSQIKLSGKKLFMDTCIKKLIRVQFCICTYIYLCIFFLFRFYNNSNVIIVVICNVM